MKFVAFVIISLLTSATTSNVEIASSVVLEVEIISITGQLHKGYLEIKGNDHVSKEAYYDSNFSNVKVLNHLKKSQKSEDYLELYSQINLINYLDFNEFAMLENRLPSNNAPFTVAYSEKSKYLQIPYDEISSLTILNASSNPRNWQETEIKLLGSKDFKMLNSSELVSFKLVSLNNDETPSYVILNFDNSIKDLHSIKLNLMTDFLNGNMEKLEDFQITNRGLFIYQIN